METKKPVSVLFALILAIFLLTAAIAAPILCRQFYYLHVKALDLPGRTGYTREEIITAYDQVLDFCAGDAPFGTGILPHSEEGAAHFADVRVLFLLDIRVAAFTLGLLIAALVWLKATRRRLTPLRGFPPAFWAGSGLLSVILVVAALAALDFDRAFTVFHGIFFPGKTNWLFDPFTDPIIYLMPQEFFRNCAILIAALVLASCGGLVAWGLRKRRNACPAEA